jgi:hypothetical protein
MLQGWYWDYPKDGCNNYNGDSWASHLNDEVVSLANAGFTYVWLPPFSRASFGKCSNGYDPKDLYDLGEFGLGPTGFGTRSEVDLVIASMETNGIQAVADVVYNHRDGGIAEDNPAVKAYIETHYVPGKNPYPSDRYRCRIPIGPGTNIAGPGDYYIKISSKTNSFAGAQYKLYATTNKMFGSPYLGSINETEPNGGGDCGEAFDELPLNTDVIATIENVVNGMGCGTDEFRIQLTANDFNSSGDEIFLFFSNVNSGYTDHRVYEIYYDDGTSGRTLDLSTEYIYQTFTDFSTVSSGQGGMNFENFKPNSSNASTTFLNGDWDTKLFFYDVDQFQPSSQTIYNEWSEWLWDDVGIRGYRMDAVKHFPPKLVGDLMNYLVGRGVTPGMVVGEHFTPDAGVLKGWVDDVVSHMSPATQQVIDMRAFDFDLRQNLEQACDAIGYDVRNLFNAGMVHGAGANSYQVVTFVNNHDYRNAGELVDNDPILAYAYILTNNQIGLPCVFYPDYYGVTLPYNTGTVSSLKTQIDELIQIQQQYIAGSPNYDYLSRFSTPHYQSFLSGFAHTTLFYQLSGRGDGNDILVAINFAGEPLDVWHSVNTGPGFDLNVGSQLTEVTNNATSSTLTVNVDSRVNVQIPARSYAVWVESGAVLPVELLSFEAKARQQEVVLNWSSASEPELAGYEIQRSPDGRSFTKIGWVDARGTDSSGDTYTYIDSEAPAGTLYYRLRAVDHDGDFEFSDIRTVQRTVSDTPLAIFPNPAKTETVIRFASLAEVSAQLEVLNAQGQLIKQLPFYLAIGENQITLPTADYSSGLYLVRITAADGTIRTGRLLVN